MDTSEPSGWGPLPDEYTDTGQGGFGFAAANQSAAGCRRWGSGAVPLSANTSLISEPDTEEMEEEDEEYNPEKYQESTDPSRYFAAQMSPEDFRKQTTAYTKAAVDALIHSPEYQRRHTTCQLCWSVWFEGMSSETCMECGGYAMQRPCPVCGGKCGQMWNRDVEMSHSNNEAFWDGECSLPPQEQKSYMTQMLLATGDDDTVLDAMELLSTS